ncbi:sugar ABC transporter ATP-binding protein [Aeromicrobium fastidiosum]|uniref:Sugar ABC transporter ATP-binding protein n=1 Tax=Aeromicrobium fastidiosum TaxID=52699 RepID=A0A641AP74_9ACTN|nr:sugar ABC transporter ATP-binding protein [Aeromicrobium fastidiosum]KAA1379894.1 sugar ABC transporter ATP-binding protein [Aeromicrobium fastidiosum]MBP2389399.1 ribose transport system ATP-binding protein [Aeromicrobium fastidiosum]
MTAHRANALELESVSKTFASQMALDSLDLAVAPGEIHALVGQNGSGKSTVVKLLAGYHAPDKGSQARVAGASFDLGSMSAAHDAGLRFVHQDLGLIEAFSVAENFCITGAQGRLSRLHRAQEERRTAQAMADFGYVIDPSALVASLSAAERTAVAIVRAIEGDTPPAVLVLDEPTASLPGPDVAILVDALRRLAASGTAVLFISHHLDEVLGVADTVTILRDGRRVATVASADVSHDELAETMLGRRLGAAITRADDVSDGAALESAPARLSVRNLRSGPILDFSVDVRAGEIVGITGLTGSGREELAGALFGQRPRGGRVEVDGAEIAAHRPRSAIRHGMAYLPAERKRDALLGVANLRENLTLAELRSVSTRGRRVVPRRERAEAATWVDELAVYPAQQDKQILEFSGGNQQKVILGRLLRMSPAVLVIDEPTQGVDIGAKVLIHDLVSAAVADGACAVVCSSDSEELVRLTQRVLVMRRGVVACELAGADLTSDRIEEELLRSGPPTETRTTRDSATKVVSHVK